MHRFGFAYGEEYEVEAGGAVAQHALWRLPQPSSEVKDPVRTMLDPVRAAAAIASDLAMIHQPGYGTAGSFRACCIDDLVVVADDITLTDSERALVASGRVHCVRDNRVAFQYVTGPLFISLVEQATGRRVVAFSGEVHIDPLFEVAVFRLERQNGNSRA